MTVDNEDRDFGPFLIEPWADDEKVARAALLRAGLPVSRENVQAVLTGWARAGIRAGVEHIRKHPDADALSMGVKFPKPVKKPARKDQQ